jgi:hypothetical protein
MTLWWIHRPNSFAELMERHIHTSALVLLNDFPNVPKMRRDELGHRVHNYPSQRTRPEAAVCNQTIPPPARARGMALDRPVSTGSS